MAEVNGKQTDRLTYTSVGIAVSTFAEESSSPYYAHAMIPRFQSVLLWIKGEIVCDNPGK
jgi:hypothetical protein